MKLSTILENGTGSSIEVTTESPLGVYTLMARIKPGEKYELRKDSYDTYLQHWVMIENAPVLSFYSDELVDNERIKIITVGDSYSREVTPRHGVPKPTTSYELYPPESMSCEQKVLEKPNLYLGCYTISPAFKSIYEEQFHLSRTIEECNVGLLIISTISFRSPLEMPNLVRMVEEAKRRSDFKILPVMLDDESRTELDRPRVGAYMQERWSWMEVTSRGSIKAADCAAAYEYIRSCDCMDRVNTGLTFFEFMDLVFDRIRGLISAAKNTENLRGIPPPISTKDIDTVRSSEIHKVREKSSPMPMMQQSTSVNDPVDWSKDFHGETKNKSADDSDSDKGYPEEGRLFESLLRPLPWMPWFDAFKDAATAPIVPRFDGENEAIGHMKALSHGGTSKSQEQKLQEKPNLYLGYCSDLALMSAFEKHFHLSRAIAKCNVGVVIISMFSLTSEFEMVDLVRMVEEAKRRSDFKILLVMLGVSLAQLDDLEMEEHVQKILTQMKYLCGGSLKARDYAAAYKYIRLCDCMMYDGLSDIFEFLDMVFDRIRGLISTERSTEKLRGIPPPLSIKDSDTIWCSEMDKVRENSSLRPMMQQSVNDPDWSKNLGGEGKSKSADDSDSGKGDAVEEGISSHTFQTPPPIPQHTDSSDPIMKAMKALSHSDTPKSQGGLQTIDSVHLQLDAQWEVEDQVEAQNARDEDMISNSTIRNKIVEQDSDDVSTDEYETSRDEGREILLDEGKKINTMQPRIDEDQIFEGGYEVFKNEIYEDIMKIDCIQELAIDIVGMETLLHDPDTIILSFSDGTKESFEFYFKSREDMARIVGVGLKHAKVTLEGEDVTITELMEEDWNQRWRAVKVNASGNMKLFKMKRTSPSNVYERLTHLDVEISSRKPLLWKFTKYFSLEETIATFASKELYAKCGSGAEASSSYSGNNGVQLHATDLGKKSGENDKFTSGESPEDENVGSMSDHLKKLVMDSSENSITTVKLQLLSGGRITEKPEGSQEQPSQEQPSRDIGEIVPNLEFTFFYEGERKMIRIVVGEISFKFSRDEITGDQSDWYHNQFRVIFGLLDKCNGHLERETSKHLNTSSGKYGSKTSYAHENRKGKESQYSFGGSAKGGVSFLKASLKGSMTRKTNSQDAKTNLNEKSHERTCEDTQGGLFVNGHEGQFRIICNYYLHGESTPSLEPIPSQEYIDQGVKFEGTWIPEECSLEFVDYFLRATRILQKGGCKDKKYEQEYKTTILVNHSLSHLDGKTYKIRELEMDGEIRLTELSSKKKWDKDYLKKGDQSNIALERVI